MEAFRARQFAKAGAAPNTFIGGIAKTGGTGANAPIDTPYKLSQTLGIDVNRITGFRVIGDDVECRIRGRYGIGQNVFGSVVSASANKNITYFRDNDGLVSSLTYAFMRCSNFEYAYFPALTQLREGSFSFTKIEEADFSYLSATGHNISRVFEGNNNLKNVDLGDAGGTWYLTFLNCTGLESVVGKPVTLQQTFRDTSLKTFIYPTVITVTAYTFGYSTRPEHVELINCTTFTGEMFWSAPCAAAMKTLIIPKVDALGNDSIYQCTKLELLDIRMCKNLATDALITTMISGGLVKANIFLLTSNGGLPDENLVHVKTIRGATVEFYDDNGDYVSTL